MKSHQKRGRLAPPKSTTKGGLEISREQGYTPVNVDTQITTS